MFFLRSVAGCLVLSCLGIIGCEGQAVAPVQMRGIAQPSGIGKSVKQVESLAWFVDEPLEFANLRIFPVCSREPCDDDIYVTLEEGLRAGTVQVTELGGAAAAAGDSDAAQSEAGAARDPFVDGDAEASSDPFGDELTVVEGDERQATDEEMQDVGEGASQLMVDQAEVERVLVTNRSDKPLYLMPGEIILGGKQDRCVGREMVIQPGTEPVEVEVYCVEHGRWTGRTSGELEHYARSAGGVEMPSALSAIVAQERDASATEFVASAGVLHRSGRLAVQAAKDQGKVWKEIEVANARAGNSAETSAFTGNYASEEVVARLKPYCDDLERKVIEREKVIGVVVAINGQIQSADVFHSTPLFRKLWPKLLQSYALDAMTSAEEDELEPGAAVATVTDAQRFLEEMSSAEGAETHVENGLVVTSRNADFSDSQRPFVTSASDSSSTGGLGGYGGGGFGGAIHASGMAQ